MEQQCASIYKHQRGGRIGRRGVLESTDGLVLRHVQPAQLVHNSTRVACPCEATRRFREHHSSAG